MKRKKGEFIGAFAPYGYIKDPADKHRLIVDKETAHVVKDIFHWFVRDGLSKNGIVRRLISMGILCPAAYKRQKGMKYFNPAIINNEPLWSSRSITAILTNQMYLGHMVQGKQKVKSYKVHTRINTPESEWFFVPDTHEPIIDTETFEKAQELMKRDTRTAPESPKLYPFSGFLRCADCGKAMVRRRTKNNVYYACQTYITKGLCTRHSIRHDKLESVVLEIIQKQISLIDDVEQLIDDINKTPVLRSAFEGLASAIKLRKQDLEKISGVRTGLYLDWKNGDITREEYHEMKKEFEDREQRLKRDITRLQEENQDIIQGITSNNPICDDFCKYGNILSLDRGIVVELIKAIFIHEGGDVTIDFSFANPLRDL